MFNAVFVVGIGTSRTQGDRFDVRARRNHCFDAVHVSGTGICQVEEKLPYAGQVHLLNIAVNEEAVKLLQIQLLKPVRMPQRAREESKGWKASMLCTPVVHDFWQYLRHDIRPDVKSLEILRVLQNRSKLSVAVGRANVDLLQAVEGHSPSNATQRDCADSDKLQSTQVGEMLFWWNVDSAASVLSDGEVIDKRVAQTDPQKSPREVVVRRKIKFAKHLEHVGNARKLLADTEREQYTRHDRKSCDDFGERVVTEEVEKAGASAFGRVHYSRAGRLRNLDVH